MLQHPQLLTKLPKSFESEKSRVYTADVHSITGGKKRKRSEIAVAVDDEGINLYDVSTTWLALIQLRPLMFPDTDLQADHDLFGLLRHLVHLSSLFSSTKGERQCSH